MDGYDAPVNERSASAAGAVCPFVAFEDDRDRRSALPDHRHRCFAESAAAPRALAHQQHYCLAAAFPSCPTFTDWARREAALPVESDASASALLAEMADAPAPPATGARDWAAPPPWVQGAQADGEQLGAFEEAAVSGQVEPERRPAGDAFRSPNDGERFAALPGGEPGQDEDDEAGLAGDERVAARPPEGSRPVPSFLAGREAGRHDAGRREPIDPVPPRDEEPSRERPARTAPTRRGTGSGAGVAARTSGGPAQARPAAGLRRERREPAAPAWEHARRDEAYPTLRTRVGVPEIPRLGLAAIALVVAAAVLFFLPTFLAGPSTPAVTPAPSANPSAAASASLAPATPAAPTPTQYTVASGDTLSGIAKRFGVTVSEILAANPQIKDPNKIAIGDQITIPPKATPVSVAPAASGPPPSSSSLP